MITLEVKLQKIFYETQDGELGTHHVSDSERITIKQAEEILEEKEISFKSVFQVRKEVVEIELSEEDLQNAIK